MKSGGSDGELERNPQLSLATRMDDWTSLAQHKRKPDCKLVPMAPDLGQNRNTLLSLIQRVLVLFSTVHEKANVLSYSTELHREGRSGRKEEPRKQCLAFHMMPVKLSSLEGVTGI